MSMQNIKHVVYYMLENRSFDNLLGWLYELDQPAQIIANEKQKNDPFYGLKENTYFNTFEDDPTRHFVQKGTESLDVPSPDPNEGFEDVNNCLFGAKELPPNNTPPNMEGFLKDYLTAKDDFGFGSGISSTISKDETQTKKEALQILQTYTPEQLSVINGLAKNYAVSDYWFSSVPAQTNCNRAFSLCGTSMGLVNNAGIDVDGINVTDGLVPAQFKTNNIWKVLSENGFNTTDDWMIYVQALEYNLYSYSADAFEVPNDGKNISDIEQFFEAVSNGNLPSFSFIEPDWVGLMGSANSYHPPSELAPGEAFLKKLYDAFNSSDAAKKMWEETLIIITFDEHGGNYDHIPPEWGATPPWGTGTPPTLEKGFGFDRFGVRVPTILISPWIDEKTVFRSLTDVPYDATSMIATILNWKGIPKDKWNLGERVANAPTFDNVLNRTTPRSDFPEVNISPSCAAYIKKNPIHEAPITDLQKLVLPGVLKAISAGKTTAQAAFSEAEKILASSSTVADLKKGIDDFLDKL